MSTLTIRLPDDTESHFRASAAMGDPARALAILDRLDVAETDATRPLD